MEQTLFIVFAAVIIFALLYKWKKRTEKKIIGGSNNEWRTILYTYNCLCFLGMEILQVGESLQNFISKYENDRTRKPGTTANAN